MAFVRSFVAETASSPGTSATVVLLGAATGPVCTFATAGYLDGERVYYKITDNATTSEEGLGTYHSTGPTLTRDIVLSNSSGTTSRLLFSGIVYVFAHPAATRMALFDENLDLTIQRNILYAGAPLLRGHLTGLTLTRPATTTIGISPGVCLDSTNTVPIAFTSAWTKKIDGTWTTGTGANGMGAGLTKTINTWYTIYAIIRNGNPDFYFDTSSTAANKPSGTTAFRRLGSFWYRSDAQINDFYQLGDKFLTKELFHSGLSIIGTTAVSQPLSVPIGVVVEAEFRCSISNPTTGAAVILSALSQNDTAPTVTNDMTSSGAGIYNIGTFRVLTNTNQQIRIRTTDNSTQIDIYTTGWTDWRGRLD